LIKVSVIVPVFNPGSNIDQCLSSLLGQSLPTDQYEVIFVDDGSTDSTPARLDELARSHDHIRVEHTPNSGWPGRPRNIGLDLARGEFVYFVDNDDWLDPRALERLHDTAARNESDVVIGKVVGHGRLVTRALFARVRRDASLGWRPLMGLLTPHKLFRKGMLDEHGIRFPEGPRRLEDHLFVVHAYFHAKRITVLAQHPCYHWVRSPEDVNASWRQFDPAGYFENVREVLDLVDEHTQPGPLRDQMHAAWYRGKMLPRVGGSGFLRREPTYRRELYEEIRRLVIERYDPEAVDTGLPFSLRVRARLLRQDRYEALGGLAEFESQLRADVTIRAIRDEIGKLVVELEASIGGDQEPLVLVRRGARIEWLPPAALQKELPQQALDLTGELEQARVQVVLRSKRDECEYVVPTATAAVLLPAHGDGGGGQPKRPVLIARADVDRAKAAAGSRLPPGEWDVHVLVEFAGFSAFAVTVRQPGLPRRRGRTLTLMATWDERLLARPPLRRRAARRFPGVAGLVKRFRPRARGAGEPAGA
jgi:poly(ribitol-phosphate) beta-N-acetylglucosaminyltransferase